MIRVTIAGAAVALLAATNLGLVQPTLTIDDPGRCPKENDRLWCVFNNWEHRDKVLNSKNEKGEFRYQKCHIRGTFGGMWYCIHMRNTVGAPGRQHT